MLEVLLHDAKASLNVNIIRSLVFPNSHIIDDLIVDKKETIQGKNGFLVEILVMAIAYQQMRSRCRRLRLHCSENPKSLI
jgi:hypothetical protein